MRLDNQVERRLLYLKYNDYAALVHNLEYIFHMDNRNKIPPPKLLRNTGKNLDQFFHYHNSLGHWTSACFILCDAIEQLVWEGSLQDFVDQT